MADQPVELESRGEGHLPDVVGVPQAEVGLVGQDAAQHLGAAGGGVGVGGALAGAAEGTEEDADAVVCGQFSKQSSILQNLRGRGGGATSKFGDNATTSYFCLSFLLIVLPGEEQPLPVDLRGPVGGRRHDLPPWPRRSLPPGLLLLDFQGSFDPTTSACEGSSTPTVATVQKAGRTRIITYVAAEHGGFFFFVVSLLGHTEVPSNSNVYQIW